MRSNIKIGLFTLTPVQLLALLNNVIAKFTGSTLFATPLIPLAELQAQSDALHAAIDDATNGSLIARKVRDAKVDEVRNVLRRTSDYVRLVCDGNAADLAKSGFPLQKHPEPINSVDIPKGLIAKSTDTSGGLMVRWNKAVGARLYRTERAVSDPTVGETTWIPVGITSRQRIELSGLEPYAPCWIRVIGVGKNSEGLPSEIVLGRAA